ncbi:hypothetical protein [Ulvibacterium sp.]|uniref:hypothetical protein n=1 Tax=Ulvibacterium sp. TaxID=2665914 RepID=UPI003CC658C8
MKKRRKYRGKSNGFGFVFPILSIIGIGSVIVFSSFYEKSWTYNWNGIRQQIRDSVKVAERGWVSSGTIGPGARTPKQLGRRIWLMNNATVPELLKLTEYPDGTIKTIAYEGLIRKPGSIDKAELIIGAIADTEYPIYFKTGCEAFQMNIGEYLVDFVLFIDDTDNSPPPPIEFINQFRLSEAEQEKILIAHRKTPSLWKK